jgi:hypothetical protein
VPGPKNPVNVTTASQMIPPTARTHGVDPDDITMMPAMATASAKHPTRRACTAILQCPLCCSSGGSFMEARKVDSAPSWRWEARTRPMLSAKVVVAGLSPEAG